MIPFARAVAWWRHLFRDRPALLIAAHHHEERLRATPTLIVRVNREITEHEAAALRAALHADLERIIYSGDHPHCGDCIVDWEDNHVTPCSRYPACSIPPPRGRHHRDATVTDISQRRRVHG